MKFYTKYFLSILLLSACNLNKDIEDPIAVSGSLETLEVPEDFEYATSKLIDLEISINNIESDIIFDLYDQENNLLLRGNTSNENTFITQLSLPYHHDSIWIKPHHIGIISEIGLEIIGNKVNYEFTPVISSDAYSTVKNSNKRTLATIYEPMGDWDSQGRPLYLEATGDVISQSLLDDIDASLPESRPVPTFNPEYLVDQDMNTKLQADADVWITFVHEGAGWKNTLGYYTYDINNPPASVEDITNHHIIFPNVSFNGSGGNLQSGDKVHLGRFPVNTGIGWFLVPNAWDANTSTVLDKPQVKYSVKSFNSFTDTEYAQHVILLKDNVRELLLLGFEDTSRPAGDNDFNDAIFYVSANPYSAIITDDFQEVTASEDTDLDGVLDHLDEYPTDPDKAFNAYIPAQNVTGSLAFEDMWPNEGDYDFNDLVMDYQYKKILSANMRVQELEANYTLKAVGGYYHNGFGIELPFSNNSVQSISGNVLKDRYVQTNSNGTESGQTNTVVIVFEDAYDIMSPLGTGQLVNVREKEGYIEPVEININIDFTDYQVFNSQIVSESINPFIIVNKNRGHEVHLPGNEPTDLVDETIFGSGSDNSNPNNQRYYVTSQQLPWAIDISRTFEYPIENAAINKAHKNFANWAESNGSIYSDWYYNKGGYRDTKFIY
ncbi:LruC domain-containing protein [Chondrinema litorale]|uniref:LruC domain-containing protein n=1 Tax=Chondrinema litorale TaxID=2994555 RepID=UPI002542E562|nr:LruC domain-containing protein [Chondrinema litorale]UZR98017.1 LruC domain-containing protein [Chondrinema litorale]